MGKLILVVSCFVVFLSQSRTASGQNTQAAAPTTYPVVIQPWPYPDERPRGSWTKRGDFDVSLGVEGLTLDTHDHDTLGFLTLGGGYHFTGRVSAHVQAELSAGEVGSFTYEGGRLEDAYVKLRAVGGLASVRYEFLRARGAGMFVDGGIGHLTAHGGFLPGRADDAWEEAVGAGVIWRLGANAYLAGGVRYVRLSTALLSSSSSRAANGLDYWLSVSFRL